MGGIVLRFPRRRHVRASAGMRAASSASASKVIREQPFSPASRTMAGHLWAGMPLSRQELTVEAVKPSSVATAPVPPKSSIAEPAVSCMDVNIVRRLRTSQEFAHCETTFIDENVPIPPMADTLKEMGRRLELTRLALGFEEQVAYCKEIKIGKNTYNAFERGKRPITLNVALKIRKRFAISLDWTICGDPSALPVNLYRKIDRSAA